MLTNKKCLFCGASLIDLPKIHNRKFCSISCREKVRLRKRKPDVQTKLWVHDPEVFKGSMELYWNGMGGAEIARYYNIPDGTVYSWIHDFGGQKRRKESMLLPAVPKTRVKSVKERFKSAASSGEWLETLRDETKDDKGGFEDLNIRLVCGFLHGQSANKLASVISESLNEDPLSGRSYAFCNKCRNTISVIAWKGSLYSIAKYIKVFGTFIWPNEDLGKTIEVTTTEFDRLLFLKKHNKRVKNNIEITSINLAITGVSCYN